MARDPTYPLIPTLNFLGCFLVLVPFTTCALKKWNIGICVFAIYVSLKCLFLAVDAIIWSDNDNVILPVWCDIVTHFGVAALVGIPACSLAMSRRLCQMTKQRCLITDKNSKRKDLFFDLGITVGFPVICMGLYYIVQGSRFQVNEGMGCASAEYNSGVSIILIYIWPVVFPAISVLFYCPRILWFLYCNRREIKEFLSSNHSIEQADFFRVMTLGCLDALLVLPGGIYNLSISVLEAHPLSFWPGWNFIHSDWGAFGDPESTWNADIPTRLQLRYYQVVHPTLAIVFFLIFGLTKQTRARHWHAILLVLRPFGVKPQSNGKSVVSTINFNTATCDNSGATFSTLGPNLDDVEKGNSVQISLHIAPSSKGGEGRKESDSLSSSDESEGGGIS